MSRGGEIFVIKSMCSFKILDLANVMMRYYKKKLKIKFIGQRNNEKLYEELLSKEEREDAFSKTSF